MKRLLIACAALLAAACQPMPAADAGGRTDLAEGGAVQSPASPGDVAMLSPAECTARGGKMIPQGRMQTMRCVVTYADAGRQCRDGDDCQGDCRIEDVAAAAQAGQAAVGQCQVNSSRFGCYTTIEDGKAEATICVD
jgi:hypothetical protein